MIEINLEKLLEKEGKSKYWLVKNANITFHCVNRLIKNEASAVYFDTLEKICIALNCEPSDVIEWKKGDENTYEQIDKSVK